MTLGEAQRKFPTMVAKLISWAYENGYELTLGDAYRDPRVFGPMGERMGYGEACSAHKQRLAIDLNLFRDGKYLTLTSDHAPLGAYWQRLGGTWGGDFNDGNHYSLAFNGIK